MIRRIKHKIQVQIYIPSNYFVFHQNEGKSNDHVKVLLEREQATETLELNF